MSHDGIAAFGWLGPIVVALLAGLLGGGAVVTKWMDRDVTKANAERAGIENLRTVIAEVEASATRALARAELLEERVGVLEERERHMLTRAAVHEAWDQMAFSVLIATNPSHPPPPPLTLNDPDSGRRASDPQHPR